MSTLTDQLKAGLPDDETAHQIIDEVAELEAAIDFAANELRYYHPGYRRQMLMDAGRGFLAREAAERSDDDE